jgi:hypothetical protein
MPLACRQFVALLLINSFGVPSAALADPSVHGPAGDLAESRSDVAGHLNSFAMIFGRYVWVPLSPKSALAAFGLFCGVDTRTEPDRAGSGAVIPADISLRMKDRRPHQQVT